MAGPEIRERLFGSLALGARLVTAEQVAECLALQQQYRASGGQVPKLGELLAAKGYLTAEQVQAILGGQYSAPRHALFGEIALGWKLVAPAQIEECLGHQHLQETSGQLHSRIGETLVAKGYLKPHHVATILNVQGIEIRICARCVKYFNVRKDSDPSALRCPTCAGALAPVVAPESRGPAGPAAASPVAVAGTLRGAPDRATAPDAEKIASISGYELMALMGSDATGTVFKARHLAANRIVALKVLSRTLCRDREFMRRFIEETKRCMGMEHPHIKKIYGVGLDGEHVYYSSEYMEGASIKKLLDREGTVPIKLATSVVRQIGGALEYGHKRGFIHGDIRPSNILIRQDGSAKLADYGVAKKSIWNVEELARRVGTAPFYFAPEQAAGDQATERSDIYSLGAAFYHMVVGRPPYEGSTSLEALMRMSQEECAAPSDVNPTIPRAISRVIKKMMASEPEARYGSASELLDDLVEGASGPFQKAPSGRSAEPAIQEISIAAEPTEAIEEAPARVPSGAAQMRKSGTRHRRARAKGATATIPCPSCGEEISAGARRCRYCDAVLSGKARQKKKGTLAGTLVLATLLMGVLTLIAILLAQGDSAREKIRRSRESFQDSILKAGPSGGAANPAKGGSPGT